MNICTNKKEKMMKKTIAALFTVTAMMTATAASGAKFPSYSAVDDAYFADLNVNCEELQNEDDCLIWRAVNNFKTAHKTDVEQYRKKAQNLTGNKP